MKRSGVVVGDRRLLEHVEHVAVTLAEEGVERHIADQELAPVGQAHECSRTVAAGVQVEEPSEQAEAPRRLPASEFAVAVGDCEAAIAADSALFDISHVQLLAEQRLHRVAPEFEHRCRRDRVHHAANLLVAATRLSACDSPPRTDPDVLPLARTRTIQSSDYHPDQVEGAGLDYRSPWIRNVHGACS
jgi:hypothetical protein